MQRLLKWTLHASGWCLFAWRVLWGPSPQHTSRNAGYTDSSQRKQNLTQAYLVASADACDCTYCKDLQCDSSGHCFHGCAESHNYGPKCQYECPNNYVDPQCTVAPNVQPKCTAGCKDGLWGTHCVIPCNKRCGRCNGPEACLSCMSGYFGPDCQSDCIEKCKGMSCNPDGTCRPDTCVDGWYGLLCSMKCPSICKTCDKVMGTCTSCDVGWYGLDCTDQCPRIPDSTFCSRLRDTDICPVCAYKGYVKPDIFGSPSKWNRITSIGLLCMSTMTVLAVTTTWYLRYWKKINLAPIGF